MKLVSNNKNKTEYPGKQSNEILFVILILFSVNFLNCECFCQLKLSREQFYFCYLKLISFLCYLKLNLYLLFALMIFGNSPAEM